MTTRSEAQPIPMSPRLVQTLGRAAEYARAQSHVEVALEHVLLALSEDEDAAAILTASRVSIDGLKTDVSGHLGRIEARVPEGHPGTSAISIELRDVLQAAAKAARQSRRGDIDGAIVLCAIVGHGQSNAAALLRSHGLTFEEAIRVLQERMRATAAATPDPLASDRLGEDADMAPAAAPAPGQFEVETTGRPRRNAESILADARSRIESRKAPGLSDTADHHAGGDGGQKTGVERSAEPEAYRDASPAMPPLPPQSYPATTTVQRDPVPAPPAPPTTERPAQPYAPSRAEPPREQQTIGPGAPHLPPQSWTPPPGTPPASAAGGHPQPRPYRAPPPPIPQDGSPPSPAIAEPRLTRSEPVATAPPWASPTIPATGPRSGPGPSLPPLDDILPAGSPPGYPDPRDRRGGPPPGAPLQPAPAAPPSRSPSPPGQSGREQPRRADASEPQERTGNRTRSRRRTNNTAVEDGQLVENIPRFMRVGIASVVEVRIAKAEVKALAEGLEGGGAAFRHDVLVTKAMTVRLRAPDGGFFIETASPETQWIESSMGLFADDFASWRWSVTPKERGRRRLQLVVSARTVGSDGLVAETALPDQVVEVRVRTNYVKSLQFWSGWIVAAVLGGVLARFGETMFTTALVLLSKLNVP
ncbi:MAG: Clp protease N-terminal domain-containing protein [Hyphomicrobiaceae bacterium]|nr:Clp protease N-terminal domain-containing protein [Hyphomicrobiaceae bacterium]